MHVLRGLQHLLHPVRQGWVLSRVGGDRGEYCAAEGRVEGRGCSAVDRVCVGEELGQGGGQQSRHLDTAQGECRGRYSVEAGVDIVPPRLPHLARLPGPGAGGPPGAAAGQGLREQDSGWTVPEDLLLQVGTKLMVSGICMDMGSSHILSVTLWCSRFHWCNHKDYYYSGAEAARAVGQGVWLLVITLYCLVKFF